MQVRILHKLPPLCGLEVAPLTLRRQPKPLEVTADHEQMKPTPLMAPSAGHKGPQGLNMRYMLGLRPEKLPPGAPFPYARARFRQQPPPPPPPPPSRFQPQPAAREFRLHPSSRHPCVAGRHPSALSHPCSSASQISMLRALQSSAAFLCSEAAVAGQLQQGAAAAWPEPCKSFGRVGVRGGSIAGTSNLTLHLVKVKMV